jgi:hypothetical protein
MNAPEPDSLAAAVSHLLTHAFREPAIVKADDGTAGVALILDGWYAPASAEFDADAESTLDVWRDRLNQVHAALARSETA